MIEGEEYVLVFPAASNPNMRIRISRLPNILLRTFPMVLRVESVQLARLNKRCRKMLLNLVKTQAHWSTLLVNLWIIAIEKTELQMMFDFTQ